MSITRYIATYVNGSHSGLRGRGTLALLIGAATVTAACLGTFPDVTIDPTNLDSLDERDLRPPSAKSAEMPAELPGGEGEQLPGSPSASFEEGLAADASGQVAVNAKADTGVAHEPAAVDVDSNGDADLSVFERLNPDGPKLLDPREFDQRLPLDAIRPIYEPLVGSPDEVELHADELVMGVSVNGESRAYPISVLRFREMVNDELGGTPILVTW